MPTLPAGTCTYCVTATCPTLALRDAYVAWLQHPHIADVVRAGAMRGEVIVLDGEPLRVLARYDFATKQAFEAYLRDHATRLRAEGLARFGQSDITFERTVGTRIYAHP